MAAAIAKFSGPLALRGILHSAILCHVKVCHGSYSYAMVSIT